MPIYQVQNYPHGELTKKIIGCAIDVHKELGPGFLESVYENALAIQLRTEGIAFNRQLEVPLFYAGEQVGLHRLDMLVEKKVIVELKAKEMVVPADRATTLSYLKATNMDVALILNFGRPKIEIIRLANTKKKS